MADDTSKSKDIDPEITAIWNRYAKEVGETLAELGRQRALTTDEWIMGAKFKVQVIVNMPDRSTICTLLGWNQNGDKCLVLYPSGRTRQIDKTSVGGIVT